MARCVFAAKMAVTCGFCLGDLFDEVIARKRRRSERLFDAIPCGARVVSKTEEQVIDGLRAAWDSSAE
jgi:hypothetical protein